MSANTAHRPDPPAVAFLLDQLADLLADRLAHRLHPDAPPDRQEATSPWMSIATAAEYLDWPKHRLYKLTAAGRIPHAKVDGRLLFHRNELDHWLKGFAQEARE